jgi:hypothetical protein
LEIEQVVGQITVFKHGKYCKKTGLSHSAIINFACGLMLAECVHATLIDPQDFDKIRGQPTT